MQTEEIEEELGLNSDALKHRKWVVQRSCATSGEGLFDGLQWLTNKKQESS